MTTTQHPRSAGRLGAAIQPTPPTLAGPHLTKPRAAREESPFGVYVWERWAGITTIVAVDHDGMTLCETSMRSDLVRSGDIASMRAFLDERSRATHLVLV